MLDVRKRVDVTSEFPVVPISNPLFDALALGQSIWYDNIRRSMLSSGQLTRMVSQDGLRGVTSNPSIFDKAIAGSTDYQQALEEIRSQGVLDARGAYEELAFNDIVTAADIMHSVYDASSKQDGYVSVEVPPHFAHDAKGTIDEAKRIWGIIDRPNLMVKVPGTPEGLIALRELVRRGINVNVTLLFSIQRYEETARAFIEGLSDRLSDGGSLEGVASVASFFISRIDSAVDPLVSAALTGKIGIASAKVAYQRYKELFSGEEWQKLSDAGASPQRLLWASTSTKNPAFPQLLYVESLIGPNTVNTIPPATYESFKVKGRVAPTLEESVEEAENMLIRLSGEGISLQTITERLLEEGLSSFADAFNKLLGSIEKSIGGQVSSTFALEAQLPESLVQKVQEITDEWRESSKVERIWLHDRRIWTNKDEDRWLGWLSIPMDQGSHQHHFRQIAKIAGENRFQDAVVLGMGGSSLCPEALSMTFDRVQGFPHLRILDSTDPVQIKTLEEELDLSKTLFFVSSKSGTTLEPNIYADYFYDLVKAVVGEDEVGKRFFAITDPGSPLERRAKSQKWRGIYHGVPSIGGRYSALSDFGMVPGAASGFDVFELLERAETMAHACAACVPLADNPGFTLGAIIGASAGAGIDKLTLETSGSISDLGAWLSQLLAESTGKEGKGVIPIDGEPIGTPDNYGADRLFVQIRLLSEVNPESDRKFDALAKAGHPVCRINLTGAYDIGREFYRWEFATAVAGSIIGINPFDQPDVEDAKIVTRELTEKYEQDGSLPALAPIAAEGVFTVYADEANAESLGVKEGNLDVKTLLAAHLRRTNPGDYVALLAYIPMNRSTESKLTGLRTLVRDRLRAATCVGFGPRFQHSTGQAYKGGPNTGVFLQITCENAVDLDVPGHGYTFGLVKESQARGDFDVLAKRARRVVRIHIASDLEAGLDRLAEMFADILGD
ncbi:MAG: bifunctional transaldolase/phosoglucose isomerase [Actinomycetota bacterium]|nr:MAG: bifunctional transaldolase/phosoglucose isomerase [Actinomycetota bacterium]